MPCGLAAKNVFNDRFQLQQVTKLDGKGEVIKNVPQGYNDITWYGDKEIRKNLNGTQITKAIKQNNYTENEKKENGEDYTYKDFQWHDQEDPQFVVWMRTASLPNFRKIYATIGNSKQSALEKDGKYQVEI